MSFNQMQEALLRAKLVSKDDVSRITKQKIHENQHKKLERNINNIKEEIMPQTTDEQRTRWPGGDEEAVNFLTSVGYTLTKKWTWTAPTNHTPTDREWDAISYLMHEWDFGGLQRPQSQ